MLCVVAYSQKPLKMKYQASYTNIPVYKLNNLKYNYKLSSSAYVAKVLADFKKPLRLKGLDQGDDLSIVLYVDTPTLSMDVDETYKIVNEKKVYTYRKLVSATGKSCLLIINNKGELLKKILLTGEDKVYSSEGFSRSTYSEAKKDLDGVSSRDKTFVKNSYLIRINKNYQKKLDNLFGHFLKEGKVRLYKIKSKKFDYSDFNEASMAFKNATDTLNTSNAIDHSVIIKSISTWESYAALYKKGKKSKVSDKNIGQIYFNICLGYLALGDGENIQKYLKSSLDIKGNNNAEFYLKQKAEPMLANYNEGKALNSENLEPVTKLFTDAALYNNMVFLRGIMNPYLTQKNGNLGVVGEYFPSQSYFLLESKTTKTYKQGTKEIIECKYKSFGNIETLEYSVEDEIDGNRNYKYSFEYCKDGIYKVLSKQGRKIFSVKYASGKISEITQYISKSTSIKYKVNLAAEGKLNLNMFILSENKIKKNPGNNFIKYTDDFKINSLSLGLFFSKNIKYDQYGNIVELSGLNAADNSFTIPFKNTMDSKGNITHMLCGELDQISEYKYMF